MPNGTKRKPTTRARSKKAPTKRARVDKWNTLQHSGPLFPPPYEKIPHNVFIYDEQVLPLSHETEEVATFYAKYLMRKNRNKRVEKKLNNNFFKSWREVMNERERCIIQELCKCDFSGIIEYLEEQREKERNKSPEEKRRERDRKLKETEKHRTAIVDDKRQTVANFMVEPPGLFFGRGNNNKIGLVKRRLQPEDVTINCDEHNIPIPTINGHRWKEVVHIRSVTWLAKWADPISGTLKYVLLDASSDLKCDSDQQKFERATQLKERIKDVRRKYTAHLRSDWSRDRKHSTALYFIDKLALRVGNEKSKEEVHTVGCVTLQVQHVNLKRNCRIEFNFNGKDTIKYRNEVKVSPQVYQNLKEFRGQGKRRTEPLFDGISCTTLNNYLSQLMPCLTTKVFRTFQATECFQKSIIKYSRHLRSCDNIKMKRLVIDEANLEVAKLLNHKKLGSNKGRKRANDKLQKKIKHMKNQINSICGNTDRKQRLKNDLRIREKEFNLKDNMGDHALQTSKTNYINPRVVLDWCRKNDVPPEKVYTKSQLKKFRWALAIDLGRLIRE